MDIAMVQKRGFYSGATTKRIYSNERDASNMRSFGIQNLWPKIGGENQFLCVFMIYDNDQKIYDISIRDEIFPSGCKFLIIFLLHIIKHLITV